MQLGLKVSHRFKGVSCRYIYALSVAAQTEMR